MDRFHVLQLVAALAAIAAICLWAPVLNHPLADDPDRSLDPIIRSSARHLDALADGRLLDDRALQRLADRSREDYWDVPRQRTWPTDEQGDPIVDTEQLDELYHVVRDGESTARLRHRYRLSIGELERLNPARNLDDIRAGQRLKVWERSPFAHSVSYGEASDGRLFHGEPLPRSDDYVTIFQHRAFGTYYTVSEVQRVLGSYADRFPEADPLIVGDLSFPDGGSMSPHQSHQSGRDIDISVPRSDRTPTYRHFSYIPPSKIDIPKTFFLIKSLIDGGYVEYIFLDHDIQDRLRREARRRGAPESWISKVFEYPPRLGHRAIVRHEPGHRDHIHVRFHCQPTDRFCR